MVLLKLAGVGMILFGLAMIIFFPYAHQPDIAMTSLGIVIGIVSLGIGLFLLSL